MFKDLTLTEVYNRESPFESLLPGTGIVLIGRADIGPAMTPVKAVDTEQVIMTFGVDSELANAYIEAKMSGATDVYLIKANGKHAETNVQNVIKLISLESVESANMLQYEILTSDQDRYLTLFNPMTGYNSSYYIANKTISQVVSEINVDAITLQSPVYAVMLQDGSTDILVDEYFSEAQTDGADPEYDSDNLMDNIVEILEYLDAYPIAQVGILCQSFKTVKNGEYLYAKLEDFVRRKMQACTPCIVTIGVDDLMVDSGAAYNISKMFCDTIRLECPVSEFINVVLARPVFTGLHPNYVSNGVAAYCGLINSIGYAESTTNKVINGAVGDTLTLTDGTDDGTPESIANITNQLKPELANLGYVVFKESALGKQKEVRVSKGANLTRSFNKVIDLDDTSQFIRYIPAPMSNIANVKLIQHIVYRLNEVLDLEELSKISTLKLRIKEVLESEIEYIKDYSVNITENYEGYAKTYVVGIDITPVGELGSINLSMQTR